MTNANDNDVRRLAEEVARLRGLLADHDISDPRGQDRLEIGASAEPAASVLLVDDHVPNLLALEAVLEPLGARMVRAASGTEALEKLLREDFAVIVMDVQMPGMDGFETAAMIRSRERTREVPIVFVTAIHRDESHHARGYAQGAVDYIAKPFNRDFLRAKVSALVGLWRRGESLREREARLVERDRAALLTRERAALAEAESERSQLREVLGRAEALTADLARSDARFRALIAATTQMIWTTDALGVVVEDSPSWRAYTGQTVDHWLGDGWLDAIHPEDRARARSAWSLAVGSGSLYEIEYRILRRDGSYRWTAARGTPVLDASGRVREWVGCNVDVDDQRRAELAIRLLAGASTALAGSLDLATTLDQIPRLAVPAVADWVSVYLCDPGAQTRLAAVAHVEPEKEALLREIAERYPYPDDAPYGHPRVIRESAAEFIAEIGPEMRESLARDARHAELLGDLGAVSAITVPLRAAGRTFGAIAFTASVSGRRYGPDDLRLVEELANRIAAALDNARLYDAAQRERARAEEASRAKDDFLATLSHELRTPMTAILGWSRMLSSGALADAKRARAIETIDRNARLQAQLIDDLLDFSRIVSGKLRLQLEPMALGPVVEAALDTVRPAVEARSVRLHTVLDESVDTILGDASRLQQVAWNLLSNAVKFTPKGGRVMVTLRRNASSVELLVEDDGQGIAPAFLPFVFDRFRQADSSITRIHGGLGLGLAIVKQLVELHGGRVEAHSEGAGKGSRFTVRLPIAPVRATAVPRVPATPGVRSDLPLDCPSELTGLRVLAVDDEPDTRELVAGILEHCGAVVFTASSAAEAFATLQNELPDVLVSDVGMPGEDGYSLIRRVRALAPERGGRTPAVALTAFARMEDRMRALATGFNSHAAKPVEPQELVLVIANLAGRFARRS